MSEGEKYSQFDWGAVSKQRQIKADAGYNVDTVMFTGAGSISQTISVDEFMIGTDEIYVGAEIELLKQFCPKHSLYSILSKVVYFPGYTRLWFLSGCYPAPV